MNQKRCSDDSTALHTDCLNAGVCQTVNEIDKCSVALQKMWSTEIFHFKNHTEGETQTMTHSKAQTRHSNNNKEKMKKGQGNYKATRILLSQTTKQQHTKKSSSKNI